MRAVMTTATGTGRSQIDDMILWFPAIVPARRRDAIMVAAPAMIPPPHVGPIPEDLTNTAWIGAMMPTVLAVGAGTLLAVKPWC